MGVTTRDQRQTTVTYASSLRAVTSPVNVPVALADRVFTFSLHFS